MRAVYFVDGVRTAFGKASPNGLFWKTRADDMGVKVVRELLRRNSELPPERIGDVVMAATAQVGDQGLTLGRDVALLAGERADEEARWALDAGADDAQSPIGHYAAALAHLVLGDDERARVHADAIRTRDDFPSDVGDALGRQGRVPA